MNHQKDSRVPFLSISDAAQVTGLSQAFLRRGCRDGSIPHVMSGCKYYVNVSRLLRELDAEGGAAE